MCRMSWKSGSLNLLEHSGPHRACYGTALPLLYVYRLGRIIATIIWTLESHRDESNFCIVCITFPVLSTDTIRLALNYIDTRCARKGIVTTVTCNTWRVHSYKICDIEQTHNISWKSDLTPLCFWTVKYVFLQLAFTETAGLDGLDLSGPGWDFHKRGSKFPYSLNYKPQRVSWLLSRYPSAERTLIQALT